jgi:prevent-host-death family protein
MTELRRRLTRLLNQVIYHNRFLVLTRNGRPVAMLIPYSKKWEAMEAETHLPEDSEPIRVEVLQ